MKIFLTLVLTAVFAASALSQELSREQKFQRIKDLNAQVNKLAEEWLQPDASDIKEATRNELKAFRLMPREIVGRIITTPREGGSYYSFTTGSNDYQKIAQIGLEQKHLKTGFAGANYGLMADIGDVPLSNVTSETPEMTFLLRYRAPGNILDARKEQRNAGNYKIDGLAFKDYIPAIVGHTYVLRAIFYGDADIAVALRIERIDSDGSIIIFWKKMGDFEKPTLDPNIKEN